MFIGKWNKSIIVTYIGVAISIIGMYMALSGNMKCALSCLIVAGTCDMFDGKIARMCKRSEEEKNFGIQLDSLADVLSFIVFPIALFISMGYTYVWNIIIYIIFAVCGIQRLAHFNTVTANPNEPVEYYVGLPVTYTALILPLAYLASYALTPMNFKIFYSLLMLIIAILNISNFKNKKLTGVWYAILSILALTTIILYMVIL